MCTDNKKALFVKFNTAYLLAKKERLFSGYLDLFEMQKKNVFQITGKAYLTDRKCAEFTVYISKSIKLKLTDSLATCNYYSCLNDGSTDSSVTDEEVVFALILKKGTPTIKYLSIEPLKIADTPTILQSIEDAFERIRNKSFTDKLVGINVNRTSVNLGKHTGLGKLVQEKDTWLLVIHCFNHQVELTLKDTFKTAFEDIDTMLYK